MIGKKQPMKKIKKGTDSIWVTQPKEAELILKRQQKALDIAWGKVNDTGKIETALFTAEAFGRGIFADFVEAKGKKWTMEKWIKPVVENVFNPMGTGATITDISDDAVTSMVFRYNNENEDVNPYMFSLFNYGFLRGMLKSAFPDGELLLKRSMADGYPVDMFMFKAKAGADDKKDMMNKLREDFEKNQ